ncbi:MAG: hypothetical protein RLZZ480_113 [Candidatus Parcubacteria bacterium]|jgi:hypothetical protein
MKNVRTFFSERRSTLLKIGLILVAIVVLIGFLSFGQHSKERFLSSNDISISGTQNGVTYGYNETMYFALLEDTYYNIPKKNQCRGYAPNDYKTWCEEWATPHSY